MKKCKNLAYNMKIYFSRFYFRKNLRELKKNIESINSVYNIFSAFENVNENQIRKLESLLGLFYFQSSTALVNYNINNKKHDLSRLFGIHKFWWCEDLSIIQKYVDSICTYKLILFQFFFQMTFFYINMKRDDFYIVLLRLIFVNIFQM